MRQTLGIIITAALAIGYTVAVFQIGKHAAEIDCAFDRINERLDEMIAELKDMP